MCLSGAPIDDLLGRALSRQAMAYRPGTIKNRNTAIRSLISVAVDMKFRFNRPTPEQLCAYVETLIERKMSPGGIRGHISNIKAYFINAGYPATVFESTQVTNALRAVDISLRHKPKTKIPITPRVLAKIVTVIETYPHGEMIAFSLALMFTAFLRQSNLHPRSVKSFDLERQLLCENVVLEDDSLLKLDLRWTKTNQKFGESTVVTASRIPGSTLCPVSRFLKSQPIPERISRLPLIRFPDGNPIPTPFINKCWKAAIKHLKIDTPNLTLHRLRLSGASWASDCGIQVADICKQGTWKSESFRSYIANNPSSPSKVNRAMSKIIT